MAIPTSASNTKTIIPRRLPDAALRILESALFEDNEDICSQAAAALGRLGDDRAVEPLRNVAANTKVSSNVRSAAAGALYKLGCGDGIVWLRKMLDEPGTDCRAAAAFAVGVAGIEELIPEVVERLKETDSHVSGCAAASLKKLGGSLAEEAFLQAVSAGKTDLVGWLQEAAVAWGWKGAIPYLKNQFQSTPLTAWGGRCSSAAALAALGEPELLVGMLRDENEKARCSAAGGLAKHGDPQGLDIALRGARSSDPEVRQEAAQALGYFKAPAALTTLVDLLRDSHHMVRYKAVLGLGLMKDKRAIAPLMAATNDRAELVSSNAARSLGELGDPTVLDRLITVKDLGEWAWLTCGIIDASVALKDSRAIPFLLKVLNHEFGNIRAEAAKALAVLRDRQAIAPLQSKLIDSDMEARCSIAEAYAVLIMECDGNNAKV